ncbi:MAG: hypothetical protein ACM3OC_08695 [Deltaproteobacteria bacterium]
MKIGNAQVQIFKIRNRKGYAAICAGNLTEGATRDQAIDRLTKAMRRISAKKN